MLDDPTIGRVASGDQVVLNMIRTTYTEAQLASSTSDFYNIIGKSDLNLKIGYGLFVSPFGISSKEKILLYFSTFVSNKFGPFL